MAETPSSSPSPSASPGLTAPSNLKIVGVVLAVTSGVLIGSSFVFKKKGLLRSQAGGAAGEGVGYLKSPLWWLGMSMMILGEICNFAAYAFVKAIVVTPLGALSVVICAILSSIFLQEKLSLFGWLGCSLCILGSVIIALNGPTEASIGEVKEFQKLFFAPGFLVYAGVLIVASLAIIFYFGPKYGNKNMFWYISVCSMIGGISVSVTSGLGAAIVTTAMGNNQFKFWFMYFLLGFVVVTLLTEVYYLNVALALFNTAMVVPTYYVIFTFFTMVTTVVLFQGLHAEVSEILTIVMAFLVICVGITILQMSKIDPVQLSKLDRRSTILLQAARSQTETVTEKGPQGIEDPGMDALRGSFGTVGSIIRARSARRMSQSSRTTFQTRHGSHLAYDNSTIRPWSTNVNASPQHQAADQLSGMQRHQLYDAPMPSAADDAHSLRSPSVHSGITNKRPTIKFDRQDVIHSYNRPGTGDNSATHEHRDAHGSPSLSPTRSADGYPPIAGINQTHLPTSSPLLDLDEPTPLDLSARPLAKQTLIFPPYIANEATVRSAPPTVNQKFARPAPGRKDSREIFSGNSTLLSFPSVTDSTDSGGPWTEDLEPDLNDVDIEKASSKSGKSGKSAKSTKRYPKIKDGDDGDESMGLWQKVPRDGQDDDELPHGGIRLVKPNSNSSGRKSG